MYKIPVTTILVLTLSSIVFSQTTDIDTSSRVFEKVEIEASFTGGVPAWRSFLEKNLNGNIPVDRGAPSGMYTVYVQFIVNKEGGISDVKALTRLGFGMEEEVVRIIRTSGQWSPAIMDGKPVKAYRKQPVTFMVSQDGFEITTTTPYTLFTNIENKLAIKVDDVKSENMEVTISQGRLTNIGDGNFTAQVDKPGRTVISVYNKKKKGRLIGSMSFEVKAPGTSKQ